MAGICFGALKRMYSGPGYIRMSVKNDDHSYLEFICVPLSLLSIPQFRRIHYGFHQPWWCPASNPHCSLPEAPVLSICSNIYSSKFSAYSLSTPTFFKMVGAPVSWASQALRNKSGIFNIVYRVSWRIWKATKTVCAWAVGRRVNQRTRAFLVKPTWVSNHFTILARSTTESVPT